MSQSNTASGYGIGTNLYLPEKVSLQIMRRYAPVSPLRKMFNWDGDKSNDLVQNSKVYFSNSLGLTADEVCDDINGQVTHLHESFSTDFLELCGKDKYSMKRDYEIAYRMQERLMAQDARLPENLQLWLDQKTVPFALIKLLASSHPDSHGLNAVGIPQQGGGVAAGLGDVNNPIKVDVSSGRGGGNLLQAGSITPKALIGRLKANMYTQNVLPSTSSVQVTGGALLETGFTADDMCGADCKITNTSMEYNISNWMPSTTNAAGDKVYYVTMHDPMRSWFAMHQAYLKWTDMGHHASLDGLTLWGAKVSHPKSVSVAAVQFV
jgi:hypothetical protein